jgi:hypothetical protein
LPSLEIVSMLLVIWAVAPVDLGVKKTW